MLQCLIAEKVKSLEDISEVNHLPVNILLIENTEFSIQRTTESRHFHCLMTCHLISGSGLLHVTCKAAETSVYTRKSSIMPQPTANRLSFFGLFFLILDHSIKLPSRLS